MNYLFYTDDDEYLHFEFQTTKKKEYMEKGIEKGKVDLVIKQLIKKI